MGLARVSRTARVGLIAPDECARARQEVIDLALALVALGGAGGAVARYIVDVWVSQRIPSAFPWGTFVVNMSGSFLLGLLFALSVERGTLPAGIRLPIMVGFIGAYTTFSTLGLETWRLIEGGATILALVNLLGSAVLGLVVTVLGLMAGRALA
jgi:CrcB protein